jgi:uncharacterized protein (UPF0264 family)
MNPRLLVSVRDLPEAQAALAGGAAVIDVKEPSRGPLGAADPATLHAIADAMPPAVCLSAALGELGEWPAAQLADLPLARLRFVKCGLAHQADWQPRLLRLREQLARIEPACQLVAVAYADVPPGVAEVARFAAEQGFAVLLIDTFHKAGRTLSDYLTWPALGQLIARLHDARVDVALAGSLGLADVAAVCRAGADYLAVRGAACVGGWRDAPVDVRRVTRLAEALTHGVQAGLA